MFNILEHNFSISILRKVFYLKVSQQMANLQLSGQAWNIGVSAASVNTPGMVIAANQTSTGVVWPPSTNGQNQNFSNNLWQ